LAEFSMLWTTGTSGDGTSTYTQTQTTDAFRDLFVSDNYASEGVLLGNAGELAVTGTSTPVSVASGAAVVYGFFYRNTAAVTFAISTPVVGTTAHRIVLRADYSAKTVRLAKLSATDGVNTPPALTQIANTTWEISLATLSITTGGVITVTNNTSRFAHYPTAVATENIDALAVTTPKIAASAVDETKLATSVAGNGLAGGAGTALSVNTDNSTIEISSDTLRVKDAGIVTAKIADLNVTAGKIAADSVDDTKAGDRVPQFIRRKGGDATHWDNTGTTDYTPTSVRQQAGSVHWTGAGASTGQIIVTFPVAFSARPLVMVNAWDSANSKALPGWAVVSSASQMSLRWSDPNGGTLTNVDLQWFAVGPE
jgi:hypothetical protein